MSAFNFPDSPTIGQVYQLYTQAYTWDGEKWYSTLGGIPLFSPKILPGLKGWWDASASTIAFSSGSNISTLSDLSGAGNTMTSGGGPAVYNATGFNSRPAIMFNAAASTQMYKDGFAFGTGNTLTAWAVWLCTGGSGGRMLSYRAGGGDDAGSNQSFLFSGGPSASSLYRNGTQAAVVASGINVFYRSIATIDPSGVMKHYLNGVPTTGGTLNAAFGATGDLGLGNKPHSSLLTADGFTGAIAEAGLATSFADATTVGWFDTYLMNKWGLNPVTNFLARTSGLDTTHVNAYTALINGLVADGIWYKLDVLHIYATQDTATAQLNLVSSSYPATLNGSPTFTVDRGYTGSEGSTTVYINTSFNPTTAPSPKYTQNSAHLSVWNLTSGTNTAASMGTANASGIVGGTGVNVVQTRYPDNISYWRINVPAGGQSANVGSSVGHYHGNRSGASAWQAYRNGASATSGSDASIAINNMDIYAIGYHATTGAVGCGQQQAAISIGSSLNGTEALAFYNRLRTYMTAVGVP